MWSGDEYVKDLECIKAKQTRAGVPCMWIMRSPHLCRIRLSRYSVLEEGSVNKTQLWSVRKPNKLSGFQSEHW